jgi:hypothetical protein
MDKALVEKESLVRFDESTYLFELKPILQNKLRCVLLRIIENANFVVL